MQVLRSAATGAPEGWVVADSELDDAAVLRVDPSVDGPYLVQTVDFITPVVDDPFVFGQVAAANALSDVYAMGGEPRFALNVVAFPSDTLPLEILGRILEGGADKVKEAGAAIVGGHTVKDAEPKYGLSVTGLVDPGHLATQGGAAVGDALILTKALGTGLLVGAARKDALEPEALEGAVASMVQLNREAARCLRAAGVRCATDVTGFGLLGHAWHVAKASGVALELHASQLPALPTARERAAEASLGGAAGRNLAYVQEHLEGEAAHADLRLAIDPQTSGGLLLSVAEDRAADLVAALEAAGCRGARIGRVVEGPAVLRWR